MFASLARSLDRRSAGQHKRERERRGHDLSPTKTVFHCFLCFVVAAVIVVMAPGPPLFRSSTYRVFCCNIFLEGRLRYRYRWTAQYVVYALMAAGVVYIHDGRGRLFISLFFLVAWS